MNRKLLYEDEEANPAVATQKAEKMFQVDRVDFLTGTVNPDRTWQSARSPNATNG